MKACVENFAALVRNPDALLKRLLLALQQAAGQVVQMPSGAHDDYSTTLLQTRQHHRDKVVPDAFSHDERMGFEIVFVRVIHDENIAGKAGDGTLDAGTTVAALMVDNFEVIGLPYGRTATGGDAGDDGLREEAGVVGLVHDQLNIS